VPKVLLYSTSYLYIVYYFVKSSKKTADLEGNMKLIIILKTLVEEYLIF
jgi:hypothetical protein